MDSFLNVGREADNSLPLLSRLLVSNDDDLRESEGNAEVLEAIESLAERGSRAVVVVVVDTRAGGGKNRDEVVFVETLGFGPTDNESSSDDIKS